jgi:hypothetical protein
MSSRELTVLYHIGEQGSASLVTYSEKHSPFEDSAFQLSYLNNACVLPEDVMGEPPTDASGFWEWRGTIGPEIDDFGDYTLEGIWHKVDLLEPSTARNHVFALLQEFDNVMRIMESYRERDIEPEAAFHKLYALFCNKPQRDIYAGANKFLRETQEYVPNV